MSYFFAIIGTRDNPLFEYEFGTSKIGGDGIARFKEEAAHMNQFIVHAALDMVEEAQWLNKDLYAREFAPSRCMLMLSQISETRGLLPEQSCSLLHDRRQYQIHAVDECRSSRNPICQLPSTTVVAAVECKDEYASGQ